MAKTTIGATIQITHRYWKNGQFHDAESETDKANIITSNPINANRAYL